MTERALAVFDIDGTLTRTNHADESCYEAAIREVWGIEGISTDWGAYEHSTDNAIAAEIHRTHRGREPSAEELAAVRSRFVELIRNLAAREPQHFEPVPGAAAALAALPARGWSVAIATGGWTPTARFKLAVARIPHDDVPAAFACDARPRETIIRRAVERAEERAGHGFSSIVYVGDGLWDLRASRRLGIGFVGVASGERAESMRREGARAVVGDYRDLPAFVARLEDERAACMKPAGG